jgi:B12 binding domain
MKEDPAMRVALLYPEVYDMARFKDKRKEFPPFGVLYLAAVIEQAGHYVTVEAVTPSRTRLELSGYDAVGFSLASSATYGLMLRARRESSFAEQALIMVGGVHCNFYPESSLADFGAAWPPTASRRRRSWRSWNVVPAGTSPAFPGSYGAAQVGRSTATRPGR